MTTMCFDVKSGVKVAKKDIKCYKLIDRNGESIHFQLKINRKPERWKVGYHYSEVRFPKNKLNRDSITKHAFHSFRSLRALRNHYSAAVWPTNLYRKIKCFIPKGTKYYENSTQYCSSDIVYQANVKI